MANEYPEVKVIMADMLDDLIAELADKGATEGDNIADLKLHFNDQLKMLQDSGEL